MKYQPQQFLNKTHIHYQNGRGIQALCSIQAKNW